ncbi:MAG: hypothetical protein RL062_129 [Bacteroidota bacterium]
MLKDWIEQGAFLVDVRTPEEWNEGHVNASVNIPLDEIADRMSEFEGKGKIVFFCRSGGRSGMAKMILQSQGFTDVENAGTWQDVKQFVD